MLANELQDAQKATQMFHAYLQKLISEREHLLNNVFSVFPDLTTTTEHLAQIDAKLAAGKAVYLAAKAQTRDLQERVAFEERKAARKAK